MKAWHWILRNVLENGVERPDRTGVGTLALFGEQLKFDNRAGVFPAVTTKRLAFKQVAAELACFIRGYDNLTQFHALGCSIWDGNGTSSCWIPKARFEGDLGRIYGTMWRDWHSWTTIADGRYSFKSTDQLQELVHGLIEDPYSRRHLVTAYNPGELDAMCLPPCHVMFQCFVADGRLDLRVDMRSVDLFLGLPFDIASYALLQRLLARETGLRSGWLTFQLGDAHIYKNHIEQVKEVLSRQPYGPPNIGLAASASLFNFLPAEAFLEDYRAHDAVPAPLNI